MTATEPAPVPTRASPAKLQTLLNLAVTRLDQAADVAQTLGMVQREQSIRRLAGEALRQLDYVRIHGRADT
jgi:selenocysteine lyase/cysteine desulfurase